MNELEIMQAKLKEMMAQSAALKASHQEECGEQKEQNRGFTYKQGFSTGTLLNAIKYI